MKTLQFILFFLVVISNLGYSQNEFFNYKKYIFGDISTLSANVKSLNNSTGEVSINGVDTQNPSIPFTFIWDDGSRKDGFFPQSHTYIDKTRNYLVRVLSHYSNGKTDSCETLATFVNFKINPISLDAKTTNSRV